MISHDISPYPEVPDLFVKVKPVEKSIGLKVGLESVHHQGNFGVVPADDDIMPLAVVQKTAPSLLCQTSPQLGGPCNKKEISIEIKKWWLQPRK